MKNAIDRIHEFDKFGSVLGLERMTVLLEKLGNPHEDLKVIHVAGTNGKGSVSKFLEKGLGACGYKMGLYTSPFIEKFNERIRLGGRNISDEELEEYTQRVVEKTEEMVAEGNDSPTEFEVVTAIAFLYFKECGADITVLEVGLGGIGDSTNVVKQPLASVISSISYDHMDRLGNTLAEISAEKAGIIKDNRPVISNVAEREAAEVIARTAYSKNSRLYDISKIKPAVCGDVASGTKPVQCVSMELFGTDYSDVEISMLGRHQAENLKTALAVIEILRKSGDIKVERSRLYSGLKEAVQPGRFEILSENPVIVIDGAHNAAGAEALRKTIDENFPQSKLLLVMGMLADKQTDEILAQLVPAADFIIATQPDNPRCLDADVLAEQATAAGMKAENICTEDNPATSVKKAMEMGKNYDVILFAGSLYLIGEVRKLLREEGLEIRDY